MTFDDGSIQVPISLINNRVWLPVRRPDGTPGAMMVGTGQYDSWVDRGWAESLGKPAGDVGPVKIGPIDLHTFVALRPERMVEVHPDGVVGKVGLNLLEHLDIDIDRANRVAKIQIAAPAKFPTGDLEFFRARALEDAGAVEAFLNDHKDSRLAAEASKLLLNLRIDEGGSSEEIGRAVQWVCDSTPKDLRTTRMYDLMREMSDAGQTVVVLEAGKLGVAAGRDDRYPNAVHQVHGLLGRTYLEDYEKNGEHATEAWRHLLSAAFGLPEDGSINLDLGRFYEKQGRYNRAYSRYVQAVIQPDSGPQALEALQRVQPLLDDSTAFSVDTIERMIAGKVRNFGAATQFEPSEKEPVDRVVMVEFFTNGHQGDEKGGAIGGALAQEGLMQHFGPEYVVFVAHHLANPQPDPLCTSLARDRAKQLGITDPGVFVIDGVAGAPGAGKWRDAEAIYQKVRDAVVARMREFTEFEFELDCRLEQVDGAWHVIGTGDVYGYEENGLRIQLLVTEAGVLAPGKSTVVVHRAVARGPLTGSNEGLPFEFDDGEHMHLAWDVSLDDLSQANQAFLDELQTTGLGSTVRISKAIDPHQVRVVAYVYQSNTGEILGSAQVTPQGLEQAQ
ncbi:MAG TPA: hypothetical protein P5218_07015 [Planctomycetota bacterium]|nr:hypothetical protein [Planctomycetota bacterium]